jgi:orotidine-5'-phosphate decarboxylase
LQISPGRRPERRAQVEKSKTRLILALDFDRLDQAERMVDATREHVDARNTGAGVFLDLKFHDIPNTVRGAVHSASSLGLNMLTIHTSGGIDMMRGALEGAEAGSKEFGNERPLIIGVTVLTSMAGEGDTSERVLKLAGDAVEAGIDGVVCSPLEVARVNKAHGDRLLTIVPGIRLGGDDANDQARVGTPAQASRDGADFIVVGRSVTGSSDPRGALARILKEVGNA